MGQNVAVAGQVPHFGPFPLEKQQKGCQKEWITKFHQIRFSACQTISHHKKYSCGVLKWKEALGSVWWLNT